jgi:Protein of unknown function (DUF3800)
VFVAFVDESGNDGQSAVFSMATIVLQHADSYYFGNDWRSALTNFGVSAFHATDFHGRRGQFRSMDDAQMEALATTLLNLFRKWSVYHSAVLVANADYQNSFVSTGFHKSIRPAVRSWKKPYLYAFRNTVLDLREFADHLPDGHYLTPVFDCSQEFMGQAQADYRQRNTDGRMGDMHVATSQEQIQLQAADLLAWEHRKAAEDRLRTGNCEPGPVLAALLEKNHFGARLWDFEHLDDLRKRVEAVENGVDPYSITM